MKDMKILEKPIKFIMLMKLRKKMGTKNIDFWEKLLNNPPESYKSWFKDEREFLQKSITKNSKVLEIGCGEGRSIKDIIDLTKNITGIDNDPKAINDAKINFKNYPKVKLIFAEASQLPFENKSYDFVICINSFVNFGDKKFIILEEMKRVLKDNGKIIISVYSEDALDERMKVYRTIGAKATIKEVRNNGTIVFDEKLGANISEQFSKKDLISIFEKVNLSVDQIIKSSIGYICSISKNKK